MHLLAYLVLLHLCGILQTLGHGLRGEALLPSLLHAVAHKVEVLGSEKGVGGQELEQRILVLDHRQLRDDVDVVAPLSRELVLHVEGAYGVDVVAEEIDTEGELTAEGIDIEDAATQRKLPRLIDIVHLMETEVAQRLADVIGTDGLAHAQRQHTVVETLARHHLLGDGIRVSDYVKTHPQPLPAREGSSYVFRWILQGTLYIFPSL